MRGETVRTLYFDCSMGAAGDMLMGALYELLEDQKFYLEIMNRLFPGVTVVARPGDTFQVHGTYMDVWIDGEEEGEIEQSGSRQRFSAREKEAASVKGIGDLLAHLPFPVSVIQNIREVYHKILEAESRVHGIAVSQIHFSRLGDLDALVDITGVCVALEMLKPDSICASPVCTGTGEIHCARGVLPVPAPATAMLLQRIPYYTGEIREELCTPTGAALLDHFVQKFGPPPDMENTRNGDGLGKKKLPRASFVHAVWGEALDDANLK